MNRMTTQDYSALALAFRCSKPTIENKAAKQQWSNDIYHAIQVFQHKPNFDAEAFRKACGQE